MYIALINIKEVRQNVETNPDLTMLYWLSSFICQKKNNHSVPHKLTSVNVNSVCEFWIIYTGQTCYEKRVFFGKRNRLKRRLNPEDKSRTATNCGRFEKKVMSMIPFWRSCSLRIRFWWLRCICYFYEILMQRHPALINRKQAIEQL